METLPYLIKVNICWSAFYAFYWLLFQKTTFFIWNRIYLVGTLLAGLFVPLITFHQIIDPHLAAAALPLASPMSAISDIPVQQPGIVIDVLLLVYAAGLITMLFPVTS